jgi:hypothetical protein
MQQYPVPVERQIIRPDANPALLGALNLLAGGGAGYLLAGQTKKGILSILVCVFGGLATCGLLYSFALVTAYDGYLLGLKLRSGQSIGQNENALEFLDGIFKD